MKRFTRRHFNRVALAAAGTFASAPAFLRGQNLNNKLNIAMIAAGGRGAANLNSVKSENIVALCDVNAKALEQAGAKHPQAKKYRDFRKLFDDASAFDAVVVSTCEHTHAFATMLALRAGKHVYCEKPLTHGIWEARQIREAAAKAVCAGCPFRLECRRWATDTLQQGIWGGTDETERAMARHHGGFLDERLAAARRAA